MLKYHLCENLLTEETDFVGQVQPIGSYNKETIIDQMLKRGTLLTRTDILAVFNELENVICDIIRSGGTINTPLFNTSFSISGVFDSPLDSFDSTRHKLNVNISKGTKLRASEMDIALEKTGTVAPLPQILEVKDSLSGSLNSKLTSGGVIELFGHQIKVLGDLPECGLWFVSDKGDRTKASTFVINKPGMVVAAIPKLEPGQYQIKIVTQYTGSRLLKKAKTCIYDKNLTVE